MGNGYKNIKVKLFGEILLQNGPIFYTRGFLPNVIINALSTLEFLKKSGEKSPNTYVRILMK